MVRIVDLSLSVLAVSLLVLPGPAQSGDAELRAKVFGVVRDAENRPVAGASVHLLSRPIPADERIGNADHLELRSDDKGMFRGQILRGRAYSAWATFRGPKQARVTAVVEDVFPTTPVVLYPLGTR